ncbi:hypothetical protein JCM1841_001188 [Sporobolomyces salmonicolor]
MVRGARVESRAAQIMRSVGKGSSGGGRRYSALSAAEQGGLDRSSSGRSHKSHKSSRSRRATAMYDLEKNPADPTAEHAEFASADDPNAEPALMSAEQPRKPKRKRKSKSKKMPSAGAVAASPGGTPGRSNTKRIWCYVLLVIILIILIILVAVIVFVAVKATQKKKNNIADGPSTDSLVSDVASSTAAPSSSAAVSDTNSLSTTEQPFSYGNTATSNSGTESASSPITTYSDEQYHPSTATSTGTGFGSAATLESSYSSENNGLYTVQTAATATESTQQMGQWGTLASTTGTTAFASAAWPSGERYGRECSTRGASAQGLPYTTSGTGSLAPTTAVSNALAGAFGLPMGPGPVVVSSTDGAAGASLTAPAGWGLDGASKQPGPTKLKVRSTPLPSSSSPMGHGHDQSSPTSSWSSSGLPTDSTSIGPYSNATISQATAPESFQTYQGNGTWFESSGHFGACGVAANNTDFVVALSGYLWLNSTAQSTKTQSPYCGAEVLLTNVQDGTSVNAWVTDVALTASATPPSTSPRPPSPLSQEGINLISER